MKTKPLTQSQYGSPFFWDAEKEIQKLVNRDEQYIETLVDLGGKAGEPKFKGTDVSF